MLKKIEDRLALHLIHSNSFFHQNICMFSNWTIDEARGAPSTMVDGAPLDEAQYRLKKLVKYTHSVL